MFGYRENILSALFFYENNFTRKKSHKVRLSPSKKIVLIASLKAF